MNWKNKNKKNFLQQSKNCVIKQLILGINTAFSILCKNTQSNLIKNAALLGQHLSTIQFKTHECLLMAHH